MAISTIKRVLNRAYIILRDYYIDFFVQRRLIGYRRIESVDRQYGVNNWQSTSYDAVNDIFFKHKHVSIKEDDVIVDVGCADCKLFNFLLYKGLKNKMLGYEINKADGALTQKKLAKYQNVEIVLDDIFKQFPANATLFYLFNPFGETLMLEFIKNIKQMRENSPVIVYNYPLLLNLFDTESFNVTTIRVPQYKFAMNRIAVISLKSNL